MPPQRPVRLVRRLHDLAHFRTLRDKGLLEVRTHLRKAPLSPSGQAAVNLHHVLPPFAAPPPVKLSTLAEFFAQEQDVPAP